MTNEEREALIAQGWTPPVAVDPDEGEVNGLLHEWLHDEDVTAYMMLQKALKRGRALAAEAKPGVVWVKHDGSDECPVAPSAVFVAKILDCDRLHVGSGAWRFWSDITHYAIITPPEDK